MPTGQTRLAGNCNSLMSWTVCNDLLDQSETAFFIVLMARIEREAPEVVPTALVPTNFLFPQGSPEVGPTAVVPTNF